MKKTYHGGCHCGAVRYEVDLDLSEGTYKCNCSICTKARNWLAMTTADSFRLAKGESVLTEYQFGAHRLHHLFCKHCGIRSFGWGRDPESGQVHYAINVACLEDMDIDELINASVTYVDGLHDNWQSPPAEVRHL